MSYWRRSPAAGRGQDACRVPTFGALPELPAGSPMACRQLFVLMPPVLHPGRRHQEGGSSEAPDYSGAFLLLAVRHHKRWCNKTVTKKHRLVINAPQALAVTWS